MAVHPSRYEVEVTSRGTVSPRTQSTLVSEVSGRIVEVTRSFRNGGFFEQGDILLTIDPRDYEIALTVARSELAQARLSLREAEAEAKQARQEWGQFGNREDPPPLVLRKPHLASAQAAIAAAEARLRQSEIDLERTRMRGPYVGRVLEKNVDVGQYVSQGTVLATVYAVDYVEVRLPLTDDQQAFLDLPEIYRDEEQTQKDKPKVILSAQVGREIHEWEGLIVRTEGTINTQSRQLFVIAQIDDPYGLHGHRPPLKVGQFVSAKIMGSTLKGVYVLPRAALRRDNEVFVIDTEKRLQRRQLDVIWKDTNNVVVAQGLAPGERITLTSLPFATDGMLVKIKGDKAEIERVRAPGSKEN
jgi:RND family efflux transporter MFP subunit